MYVNAHSIVNKIHELQASVCAEKPDIIGITESWTYDELTDSELALEGFDMFRQDRPGAHRGGGVLLYVRSELNAVAFTPRSKFPEQIWCCLSKGCPDELLIGVCYRTTTSSIFVNDTAEQLRDLIREQGSKHLLLMGDFNYPDIDWSGRQCTSGASVESKLFLEAVEDSFLTQHVLCATRKEAVLDLVLTDEEDMVSDMQSLGPFSSSDHNWLSWNLEVGAQQPATSNTGIKKWDYKRADFAGFIKELTDTDWTSSLEPLYTDEAWQMFRDKLMDCENRYIPQKTCKKTTKPIWMTHKAMKKVQRKHKAYATYKQTDHPAYVAAAKAARREVRAAKLNFETKMASNVKTDKKSFFAYVRSKLKSKAKPGPLVNCNGEVINDLEGMSEEFNRYFSSVFTTEKLDHIPKCKSTFPHAGSELQELEITDDMVLKSLEKLRSDKSPGADNISPRLLKEIGRAIVTPVRVIFQKSINSGVVPEDWRTANVCPIYKKGKRDATENYRPISLTSQLGKILESMIRDVMVHHLESFNLIRDSQHGFRGGRSCLTNLLVFLDTVSQAVDAGHSMDIIYLDFAKAFDKVPHQRLLEKVKSHGISGKLLTWIESWLSHRKQRVQLQGKASGWIYVTSGVPQGSVLGPLLFLIFINDLEEGISSTTRVLKFADDSKMFGIVNNKSEHDIIQKDLDVLQTWADTWQMEFNVSKCKVMHLGYHNMDYSYSMYGQMLQSTDTEKDLGVLITSDLKSGEQCTAAYMKANKMLGLIKRTLVNRDRKTLLALYKAIVRPHLEYCCSAWAPHYAKDKELLEKVQHRFTRLFKDLRDMEYLQRLNCLGLWTLEERRNRSDLIEVFKMCRGHSAIPFESFFVLDTAGRTRGHSLKISKQSCSKDIRKYFFSHKVVNRWNSLPDHIVQASSLNVFKNGLQKLRSVKMGFFMDD